MLQLIQIKDEFPDIIWNWSFASQINDIEIGDVTNNGLNEVIISTDDSTIKVLDGEGRVLNEIKSEDGATVGKIATIITTTAIIGGLQSQQVLKFVLGLEYFKENGEWSPEIGEPLIGKQLNYNGLINKFNIIEKSKDPKCWTCSHKKSIS